MARLRLGRYRLEAAAEKVAGVPLPAEDTLLERRVDLLLVPAAATAEPARLARIRQEVERAAAFVHPNVATVYGLEEADGQQFVTLQPMPGRSLASVLATAGLPLETTLEVALVLCDVLASAKGAGVVHGGLHPDDVSLGDEGAITVSGFGLHEVRLAVAEELGKTGPAATYQPPEAAPGLLPDHRADLFALGRLLEEMLPPEEQAISADGRLSEPLASGLHGVLERCLSEDPAQRPHSAAELRPPLEDSLRELLHRPEPEPEDEMPRRRLAAPVRWGALAAAVLLAAMAGWALWRGLGRADRPIEVAVEETVSAIAERVDLAVMPFAGSDDAAAEPLARGFGREVTRLLEWDRGVSVVTAGSAAVAAAGDATLTQLGQRLGVEHVLEGRFDWQRDAEISRAEVSVRLSRASDGEVLLDETLEGFFGEIVELQERIAIVVARRLGATGRPGGRPLTASLGAYEAYLEAVGRAATAGGPEESDAAAAGFEQAALLDPGLLLAHTGQIHLQILRGADDPASEPLAAARRTLVVARQIDPQHPEVRRAAGELELASAGDPAVALGELNAALERLPGQPDLLAAVALIDRRQGRWDEAIEGLTTARRRDPLDLDLAAELVRTLAWKRQFGEAAELVQRLAELLPERHEPALLHADLVLHERGATDRARAVLEAMPEASRSASRWQKRMLRLDLQSGEYQSALARLPGLRLTQTEELIERAWIHHHMGDTRRAATYFERARDLLDDLLEAAPGDPQLSALLGQAYAGTGGAHLGIRMGQRAVAQLPVTVDAVGGAELVERLARIFVLAGDVEHALDELAFLLEIPSPVTVAILRLDPTWEPLRSEARFQTLLERFEP